MGFRQLILVLTITVSILIMSLLGVSYAWYSFSDPESEFEISTEGDDFDVLFAQSNYISLNSAVPITAAEVDRKAGISRFSVTLQDDAKDGSIVIKLVNIKIDEELKKSKYFRIQLYCVGRDDYCYESREHGLTSDITSDSLILLEESGISNLSSGSRTAHFELKVWIEDAGYDEDGNPIDQNELMGKSFSAQIQISSLVGYEGDGV